MHTRPVRQARAHLSAMFDACLSEGPQLVTHHGIDAAVLLRVDEWQRLQSGVRPTLKQLLLAEHARCNAVLPARANAKRHAPALMR
jgi:antitoxin Phd